MRLEITHQVDNALFARKDIRFTLHHDDGATPARSQVRQLVAGEIGTKTENVVVDHMASSTGMAVTKGTARAYQSADLARQSEPEHLLKRNNLFVEKKKEAEAA